MKSVEPFITSEERIELALMLNRKYAGQVGQRYFEVDVRRDGKGVYAKVVYRDQSGSFYYPVEGRLAHEDHTMNGRDGAMFLIDYIDAYFEEYIKDGETFLPIDWSDYEADGVVFQLKGQILNLEAERLADEILAQQQGHEAPLH